MKKLLSVFLALAMLLSFGAVVAFAEGCACEGCEDAACECIVDDCAEGCECVCHEEDDIVPPPLSGYELWKIKLTTGELGAFLQSLGQKLLGWGDWILKVLYYVCFGWLLTIDITITPR